MPAPPRWLLRIPDAIQQLARLDRDLVTRRDVEVLLGVSRQRASQLMRRFGAHLVAATRVVRRADLVRQLEEIETKGGAFQVEGERQLRVVDALRRARVAGVRVRVPREAARARLGALPDGLVVEPNRIEMRFDDVEGAVVLMVALATLVKDDFDRFEAFVAKGRGH